MSYKQSIIDKVEKYKAFFNDDRPGQILASISPYTFNIDYSQWGIKGKWLNEWDFDSEADDFIDYCVRQLRCFMEYTKALDNDYIPGVNPGIGVGLASSYFSGNDITIGKDTSWVHPAITDWEKLDELELSEDNKWYRLLEQMTKRIMELNDGDYAPSSYCFFAPSDMSNALRGNELFYDYFDNPEKVHKLMDKSAEAIIWLRKKLHEITGFVEGGSVTADMWIPGNAPYMSEDSADLCSAEIYREFCAKYTQKVINEFGGAYIHHHAKGEHIHKEIAKLNGLKVLEISLDPNCPRPIDKLSKIYEWNNGIPLQTRCTAQDVYEKIEELKKCRTILMLNVKSLEEGKEVMNFIRKHSKI